MNYAEFTKKKSLNSLKHYNSLENRSVEEDAKIGSKYQVFRLLIYNVKYIWKYCLFSTSTFSYALKYIYQIFYVPML